MKLLRIVLAGTLHSVVVQAAAPVLPGVDVLREEDGEHVEGLRGQRVGLITNHTGRAVDGTPTLTVLRDELGLNVVALFSPEHGFTGDVAAGDDVPSEVVDKLPIYSLYGETRAPTTPMLEELDALVFDIQDIGVRFYTYVSTMKLAMDAAAERGVRFVVLDRPNPNGGVRVEGPVLDPDFASFVGVAPLPLVHGMTVGELARWLGTEPLELDVVPVRGWRRDMSWEEAGLPWNAPSPNIRTVQSALAYPALGLLEGVNVSEGRGIDETFERVGAPWIDGERLAVALNGLGIAGATFRPTSFTPRKTAAAPRPKYRDQRCYGVVLSITSPRDFEAVRTGLEVIAAIRANHPDDFEWVRNGERYWIDLLLGTDRPRRAIDAGVPVETILEGERQARERFLRARREHLLY